VQKRKDEETLKMVEAKETPTQARCVTRFVRISPRKVRLVLETIRRKPVLEALVVLANLKKRAARVVEKSLKSALANAKQKTMDEGRLFVRMAFADGGPVMKRYLPRAMGRADTILKRSTHLTVVLEEGETRSKYAPKGESKKEEKQQGSAKKLKRKEAAAHAG